jgi:hypothetical protein
LERLSPSQAAWYSSADATALRRGGCTPNTRTEVLERLISWAHNGQGETVYWLNGMAGTGKTTIAYSLCDQLQSACKLAASFFCSRQLPACRNVNLILPTISYQLALFSRPFRYALSHSLERNPGVHTRQLPEQFDKLIVEPLHEVAHTLPADLIVVIDALDECDKEGGVDQILDILLSHASKLSIRFCLTSRPDADIRDRMLSRKGERTRFELHLHELKRSIVQEDIKTYLQVKLEPINLSTADLERLTQRAGVLFIYAATAARYIAADNFSRSVKRLKLVLDASASSRNNSDKDIDVLYATILDAAFNDTNLERSEKEEMDHVLHTVICAQEPLTMDVMAKLLELDCETAVRPALRPLLSVLNVSDTSGLVTTLHESFPDYMLDQTRSNMFYCNPRKHHALLVQRCFDIIKAPDPPFNICGLESSYLFDKDVPGIDERVEKTISKELFYACRYWGTHLELAVTSPDIFDALFEFLSTRLLLWMEVLSLKQCIQSGSKLLSRVQAWSHVRVCCNISISTDLLPTRRALDAQTAFGS